MNIAPEIGERALIVGQTGSGKTAFAAWLLPFLGHQFIVIYDTKIEPKFSQYENCSIVETPQEAKAEIKRLKNSREQCFIVVRPSSEISSDPELLDGMLTYHYNNLSNVACYIDEAYTFHKNGNAGAGLIALLTRGRSRKITTIISTQRPAWLSRFCISEAQKFYAFRLIDKRDAVRLGDVIPDFAKLKNPNKYWFHYFDYDLVEPILFSPINHKIIDSEEEEDYKSSSKKIKVWY
jgi:energy-coupling factor transporter ATP-binding protein EcfA2